MSLLVSDLVEGTVQNDVSVSVGPNRDGAPAIEVRIGRVYSLGASHSLHHLTDPDLVEEFAMDLLAAVDHLRTCAPVEPVDPTE